MVSPRILVKSDVLDEGFIPEEISARKEQLRRLKECFVPAFRRMKPVHVLLTGPSGSGKSLVAQKGLQILRENRIPFAEVNCWENQSVYSILDSVVGQLRILGAEKGETFTKIKCLRDGYKNRPLIIFLDEIDRLMLHDQRAVLYHFSTISKVGLICISQDDHFYHSLEDPVVKSRFYPTMIEFSPYSKEDIYQILHFRCQLGLSDNAIHDPDLKFIAMKSDGNARTALQILRKAALLAERVQEDRISRRYIRLAIAENADSRYKYQLEKNRHFRVLFDVIEGCPGILSGSLWKRYKKLCTEKKRSPVAHRTFLHYLKKMEALSLITSERASVRGNVRSFWISSGS
jgi:cell division control protein 6